MSQHLNSDDDWTPLFGGWTAEGLMSQCQRWQEWMDGTYFANVQPPGVDNPEPPPPVI
ncbi:hypothetical protein ACQPW1_22770 [Nocardia sp. CA-128927]|uniref:hypothetical protein n=1 Tax=Nocardia sp. CA-128927 TaxID=3239975 RepID=UPI003D963658